MAYQLLIVDDDREFLEELADCLHQYRVLQATNGDDAIKIIKKPNTIDLVILDIILAGQNGIDILREVKRLSPELPVIILTGKGSKDVAVEALRGNANDFFEKPLDIERFEETIRRILNIRETKLLANKPGEHNKIEQAKQFVRRNYDKMVNLKDVAAEVCLSPKYFSRMFKENTGLGFNDYKLQIRTQKAEELLTKTSYPIHQIAEKFGYKNLESFIRTFKKSKGLTPSAYRKKQKNKAKSKK